MRIISGIFKGLVFEFQKNKFIRPTQNMVREALFNILADSCEGASVLDLCCGTGSLGLEALSRGAKDVLFIDTHCDIVQKNVDAIKKKHPELSIKIIKSPLYHFLKRRKGQWDIIFLDPPLDKTHLYESTLKGIIEFDILKPSGILLCESRKQTDVICPDGLILEKEYYYGDTKISVVKKA